MMVKRLKQSIVLKGTKYGYVPVMDVGFRAVFYYSTDGKYFLPIGNELSMGLGLVWTANRFALFNFSKEKAGEDGYTDFNWFRFTNK